MPRWKKGGYLFQMYENDHPPLHVHIFGGRKRRQLDRYDLENGRFMDGSIGRHRARVLKAMRELGII